ncbi:MAG: transcriptional repressor [Chloroflexi bacterium HGW-Chloroflexi-8]|nr:MAG: transcriptional repressor [Chloroflexi bacterium HGW-Chloroflexi-8]
MTDPEVRFNHMIAALKERNFRLTPQRIELVRLIAVSEGHPSASQLHKKIKHQFPTMSHATVYKTLSLLKEMNQVLEIKLRDDSHYDGNRPEPHPHLICIKCNNIMDGDVSLDTESLRNLEESSGYKILRPQISLYGLCPRCKEEN